MKLKFAAVLAVTMLSGCASKPAPELPMGDYDKTAFAWVTVNRCIEEGMVEPETGAWAKRYISSELNRYSYNRSLLENDIQKNASLFPRADTKNCNALASYVADKRIQTGINNANVERSERQIQEAINARPKNVYCNTVGGVTMCNGM